MRILVLTERYFPEEFLINDLVAEWNKQGLEVEVLTQVPSYPHDKIFEGYRNRGFQTTKAPGGVSVHRVRTVLGYNRSVVRKVLNYLNFAARTSWWSIFRGRGYDCVFIYHTGPLTMATAALVLHGLWRKRCVIWTQDLWPDAVFAYGFKKSAFREWLLGGFVKLIYAACSEVLVSCPGYVTPLMKRLGRKITFLPQWDIGGDAVPEKAPDGRVVFLFAGNMGVPQNLERVICGFRDAKLASAELHLVGGGVMLEPLRAWVEKEAIPHVFFHGRQPRDTMSSFFAFADVLLLPLTADFALTLPGKFQAYLKAGRPIFGVLRGSAEGLIRDHDLGVTADPENVSAIARGFSDLHAKALRQELGHWRRNCLALSADMFLREKLIAGLVARMMG